MGKPIALKEINTNKLQKLCEEYINFMNSDEYNEDNEYDQYIFEEAMITIFGRDIFNYINDKIE